MWGFRWTSALSLQMAAPRVFSGWASFSFSESLTHRVHGINEAAISHHSVGTELAKSGFNKYYDTLTTVKFLRGAT